MFKIVICNDPVFSIKDHPGKIEWSGMTKEAVLEKLFTAVKSNRPVALAYAEYLFSDEVAALSFFELISKTDSNVTFFCHELNFPAVLTRYAVIEPENLELTIFSNKINTLPFSNNGKKTIFENFKGFPFSRIDGIIADLAILKEEEAISLLLEKKRGLLRQNEILEVVHIEDGINQIGGLSELKKWIVERKGNFSEDARNFGIPMPKGMLMLGVQGCGKSLTSKVIANIWNFPLVRLDFINLFRKGRSVEELLKDAIATLEGFAPVVLWIDELEKALSQESEGAEIRRVLGWLMTWMQEKKEPVFLVATANKVSLLPPELLRKGRFDEIFFVDLPSKSEREEIFKIHLKKRNRKWEEFDIEKLATDTESFSGAEIEQIVVDGLITAYSKSSQLSQKMIEEVLRRTVPLSKTYEESIKELRLWSRNRARNASGNRRIESFFEG
ncbi:MAG TPA: AAA family ATPase [bacterium]|nr:AAA family ATPase [bacterium]HPS28812.1 AAA family ATPase [bacterium]